jgi:hypothetical protein
MRSGQRQLPGQSRADAGSQCWLITSGKEDELVACGPEGARLNCLLPAQSASDPSTGISGEPSLHLRDFRSERNSGPPIAAYCCIRCKFAS